MGHWFPNILRESSADVPVDQGVYRPKRGDKPVTLLFCIECQTTFFSEIIDSETSELAYVAAAQIAEAHGKQLRHVIHRADPERPL